MESNIGKDVNDFSKSPPDPPIPEDAQLRRADPEETDQRSRDDLLREIAELRAQAARDAMDRGRDSKPPSTDTRISAMHTAAARGSLETRPRRISVSHPRNGYDLSSDDEPRPSADEASTYSRRSRESRRSRRSDPSSDDAIRERIDRLIVSSVQKHLGALGHPSTPVRPSPQAYADWTRDAPPLTMPLNDPSEPRFPSRYGDPSEEFAQTMAGRPVPTAMQSDRRQTLSHAMEIDPEPRLESQFSVSQRRPAIAQMTRTQPSTDHIRLKHLRMKDIFTFMDAATLYLAQHAIYLPLPTMVDRAVKNKLMARFPTDVPSDVHFYSLSTDALYSLVQRYLLPTSRSEFCRLLTEMRWFPDVPAFNYTMDTYYDIHEHVLAYNERFKKALVFLSFNLRPENMPYIDNKPGGIARIYLEGLPGDFGKNVFQNMRIGSARTFAEFLAPFMANLNEWYLLGERVRATQTIMQGPSTSVKKHANDEDTDKQVSRPVAPRRYPPPLPRRALHNIYADSDEPSSHPDTMAHAQPHFEPARVDQFDSDDEREESDYKSDLLEESPARERSSEALDAEEEIGQQRLNAMMGDTRGSGRLLDARAPRVPLTPAEMASRPCFRKLNKGECTNVECPYSHDNRLLEEVRAKEARAKSDNHAAPRPPKKPGGTSKPGDITILSRKEEYPTYSLAMLEPTPGYPDLVLSALGHALDSVVPDDSLATAVMAQGHLMSGDKCGRLPIECMFDSGALQASYISKAFLDAHRSALNPLIKPTKCTVVLADGKSKTLVSEKLVADMSFTSKGGHIYQYPCSLLVIEMTMEAIVGLPDIVLHLLPYFVEKLEEASLQCNGSKLNQCALLSNEDFPEPISPWSEEPQSESEEERMCPDPCSFTSPLHYLSMSYDDAKAEYFSLLEKHIAPEFRKQTDIIKLLGTDLALGVFLPQEWLGVNGMEPLVLKYKDTMPTRLKPPARNINPKLYETSEKEFKRLRTYFYRPSHSAVASPLCIAFKATPPGVRFCGDYSHTVNPHMLTGHYPIPHVRQSLQKIIKFKIFLDFDLTNGFHQFKLSDETSALLSVQTPWGQFEPVFLPEGVPQGSGILQEAMMDVYSEFSDWAIVIFDNLLVLAHDMVDAYAKTKVILERSKARNMVLKMKKTWLGFESVTFFGYECTYGSYKLGKERKDSIMAFVMPTSKKAMKRFLGCAGFFQPFMPNYSDLTCQLNDMSHDTFDWNPSTWSVDYVKLFEEFKVAVLAASALFYPDYSLPWILRADASDFGVGHVLMQVQTLDGVEVLQPIMFGSKKFTPTAMKWHTYAKECFAMFYAMKGCEFYIRAKEFIFEGDHANIQWIERSTDAKVIRWKIFMQSFIFTFRHLKGFKNYVADWQSRFHAVNHLSVYDPEAFVDDEGDANQCGLLASLVPHNHLSTEEFFSLAASEVLGKMSPHDMLSAVHGKRNAHMGVRRLSEALDENFPGHGIPEAFIREFRAACPTCQKNDAYYVEKIYPKARHLKTSGPSKVVGIDYLTLVTDKFGNHGAYVMRDHFSRLLGIYPTATRDATSAALSLFSYLVTYGMFECLISDPGSELMSETVALLNE